MNNETRIPASLRRDLIVQARDIEAAFGGPLLPLLGNDASRMRAVAQRDVDNLPGRRHFEVERHLEVAHQTRDVLVDDVPAIFAQMRGDAIGAGGFGQARGP